MPINPPQPSFNSMATIDFMGMARAETAYDPPGKIALELPEEPAPDAPVFSDVPSGTRWSKNAAASLGSEDTRPPGSGKAPIKGWQAYPPAEVSDDPMGDGLGGGGGGGSPVAAHKAVAKAPVRGASPPPKGKALPPPKKK